MRQTGFPKPQTIKTARSAAKGAVALPGRSQISSPGECGRKTLKAPIRFRHAKASTEITFMKTTRPRGKKIAIALAHAGEATLNPTLRTVTQTRLKADDQRPLPPVPQAADLA